MLQVIIVCSQNRPQAAPNLVAERNLGRINHKTAALLPVLYG